ncbi:MAG: DUF3106 domain-containing protein [Deltaproteobacteria bacterium]|nr:DUF3106 domain-containing protein [Deltaproteobacteria bacterium]
MWLHDKGSRQPWRRAAVLMLAGALLYALGTPAAGSSPKPWPNIPPGVSPSAPVYGAAPYFAKDKGQQPPGFQNLPPEEKGRMQRQYREWQTLPPDQKDTMRRRMDDWNRMPQQNRDLYQQRYQQYQRLSPEERRQLENNLQRWDRLSPQERDSIRKRFNK